MQARLNGRPTIRERAPVSGAMYVEALRVPFRREILRNGMGQGGTTNLRKPKGQKARGPASCETGPHKSTTRALADRSNVRGLEALRTLDGVELHFLTFRQGAEAIPLNRGVMTENVLTPIVLGNETEALRIIEPLHCASCHLSLFLLSI